MTRPSERPVYRLVIRAKPDSIPAMVRLRRAIKHLLRWFGLQVVRIEEIQPDAEGTPRRAQVARPAMNRLGRFLGAKLTILWPVVYCQLFRSTDNKTFMGLIDQG